MPGCAITIARNVGGLFVRFGPHAFLLNRKTRVSVFSWDVLEGQKSMRWCRALLFREKTKIQLRAARLFTTADDELGAPDRRVERT